MKKYVLMVFVVFLLSNICYAENWVPVEHNGSIIEYIDLDSVEHSTFNGDSIIKVTAALPNQNNPIDVTRWWIDTDSNSLLSRSSQFYENSVPTLKMEDDPSIHSNWSNITGDEEVSTWLSIIKQHEQAQ